MEKEKKENICVRLPKPIMDWLKQKAYTKALAELKRVTLTDAITEVLQQAKEREENEQNI